MADYGIKILKRDAPITTRSPKDFFLKSENVLLKIHKQGSFKGFKFKFSELSVTIQFPELNYRPLVLVYAQRWKHVSGLDSTYHLLEWSYLGATKIGWQKVEVYKDKFIFKYNDDLADDANNQGNILGYYYVFKEEVKE